MPSRPNLRQHRLAPLGGLEVMPLHLVSRVTPDVNGTCRFGVVFCPLRLANALMGAIGEMVPSRVNLRLLHLVSRVNPDGAMTCRFGVVFLFLGVGIAPLAGGGVANPGRDASMRLCSVSRGGLFVARVELRPGRASGVSRQFHHAKQEHAGALPNAVHDALPFLIGHGILPRSCGRHYTAPAHGCPVRISILAPQ